MKTLYQSNKHWNHYLRPSARAPWWDYGKNGVYFITICTQNRLPLFGSIRGEGMELSPIGALAKECWMNLSLEEGVRLDAFVIMPNHIHGILVLDRSEGAEPIQEVLPSSSSAHPCANNEADRKAFFQHISPKKGSLPHLIRKFKALVTRQARIQGFLEQEQPLWQARYYDRIVRDNAERCKLQAHINNNITNWRNDDYYCPNNGHNEELDKVVPPEESKSTPTNTDLQPLLYEGALVSSLQIKNASANSSTAEAKQLLFVRGYGDGSLRRYGDGSSCRGGKDDINIVSTDGT